MPAKNKNRTIDIPLDGVGKAAAHGRNMSVDIPLDGVHSRSAGENIFEKEIEMVNRHHAEIKELHRRALRGE